MIVSFIIVAYNAENSISNILENLVDQDYDHKMIEVVLVDSNSSDKTKIIMDDFKSDYYKEFKRIIVLENIKKTLPCGWNVALKEVKGDIILRVDAHVTIPNNFISRNVDNIVRGEDICGGKVTSIIDENSVWQKILLSAENSMFGGGAAKFRRSNSTGYVSTLAFAAYKRCVFETVGGYDERLARTEDNEIHYRMKKAGYRFYFDPTIQSFRQSRNTLSKFLKQKFLNGFWIGQTTYVSKKCFSFYHFVPFLFILGIITTGILNIYGLPQLGIIMWISYGLVSIILAGMSTINERFAANKFLLPILFLLMHICYGLGTIIGLVRGFFNRVLIEDCDEIYNVKKHLNTKISM